MPENKIEFLKSFLRTVQNEKRYTHSLCVADEAKRLALKYGGDSEKAYLAGLLHDVTKNMPNEEHLKLFSEYGITLSEIEKNAPKLYHAISGAAYIKNQLKIDDPELLDAVRYHTTAKAGLSLFGKILYIADFTSADRDFEDVEVIRRLADESLDKAMVYALQYTILDLVRQRKAIHPDTVAAYNRAVC